MKLLKEGDIFQGLEVTRISDSFCFFEKKRMSWETIKKLIDSGEKIQFKRSPNKKVDWTKKEEVIDYHTSFKLWSTYISGYSGRFTIHKGIFEVKDDLVYYNGEYYLPCPVPKWEGEQNFWNVKQENIKDGKYNIAFLKQENTWYPKENPTGENIVLNLFILGTPVVADVKDLKPNTNELWASKWGGGINFDYNSSLWDGLSFSLKDIDVVKLFRKYFVKQRWSDDDNIEISDKEIINILRPIEGKIRDIVTDALERRKFNIDVSEEWGEVYISDSLQFDESVATSVFVLIKDHISNLKTNA